jgi:CheY-like chemotaxis protein
MPQEDKVSLMIVEDDVHIRYLLEAAAERAGVFGRVTSFPDGEAAIAALRQSAPADLPAFISTDLSMPRMTGIDLVRAIKSEPSLHHIPIGIITSSDLPNDREDALAAGACTFIAKPQGLDAMIKALLSMYESCVAVSEPAARAREVGGPA